MKIKKIIIKNKSLIILKDMIYKLSEMQNKSHFSKNYCSSTRTTSLESIKHVVVSNIEKKRPKKIQQSEIYKGSYYFNEKKQKIRETIILENGYWIAHVYFIPVKRLEIHNLRIQQYKHNFIFNDLFNHKVFNMKEFKEIERNSH